MPWSDFDLSVRLEHQRTGYGVITMLDEWLTSLRRVCVLQVNIEAGRPL